MQFFQERGNTVNPKLQQLLAQVRKLGNRTDVSLSITSVHSNRLSPLIWSHGETPLF